MSEHKPTQATISTKDLPHFKPALRLVAQLVQQLNMFALRHQPLKTYVQWEHLILALDNGRSQQVI